MHLLVVEETSSPGTKKGHLRKETTLIFDSISEAIASTTLLVLWLGLFRCQEHLSSPLMSAAAESG